jgi:DNA ligase 1
MNFTTFAQFLSSLESVSSRNQMTTITADFLKQLDSTSVKPAMYLLQGRLAPKYVPIEFNFSLKLIIKSLSLVLKEETVLGIYKSKGDAGLMVEELLSNWSKYKIDANKLEVDGYDYSPKELKIQSVFEQLNSIATATGSGSQDKKMQSFLKLILSSDPLSARYISRIIIGALRIGMSEKTLLDGMSWAVTGDKSLRKNLDNAFGYRADIGELAKILVDSTFENVTDKLNNIKLVPGTPVASKLVEREASSEAVWHRMPNCFVQPKLDGLRGQIHYDKKNNVLEIYSRNMENMTAQYPEIHNSLKGLNVDSIILDSEIIGFNESTNSYSNFQDTMKRKRKFGIEEFSSNIPVKAMCFDCLYLNGEDLTNKPIELRLQALKKVLSKKTKALDELETIQMNSEDELEEYFKSKVEAGLEGIITKQPNTDYEPGTRNFKWIKLKANTRSDLVDTIDVAIIGYYVGRGDRSRFGFGALLAAAYNPKDDKYYSLGKVGSGFTEEQMKVMFNDMSSIKLDSMPDNFVVKKSLYPDVWLQPKIVAEIDADEITRSPNHTAAVNIKANVRNDDSTKGLSVRFPRMKKWKRDKDLPNTVDEIIRMYELRKGGN